MIASRLRHLLPLALLALVALPASAGAATTFGANLDRPPDNPYTCPTVPGQFFPSPTCSAESIQLVTGESGLPPAGDGVVSRVRVRVGPVTGPMQIVQEQALRQDNPGDPGHPIYACCKAVDASPVFTPAANAVTTVNVNFQVKQSVTPEPSGYYVDDHLALSVLDPNVPIPANVDPNASVGLWFPAWQVGEERAGSFGTSGAVILFNADWDPAGAGGGGGGGGAGGAAPVALGGDVARVRNGRALLDLICNLGVPCTGDLLLQNQQAAQTRPYVAKQKPKGRVTYAKSSFDIPAGKTKQVKAKLKRAGKQLLEKRKKAKVWANVKLDGSAAIVPPVRIKLKR